MSLSDDEIIRQIRGGAKPLFARLIDRYKHQSMALAVRMLKNRRDAEEAVQDAFIRAYNALEKFEGSAKFGTWLYRILYNVCLTRLGKRREEFDHVEFEDGKDYASDDVDAGFSVDDVESNDLMQSIIKIMESLPAKYASVLCLFYVQDLSHEEICEVTQLPLGTVKTHLFRARVLLQKELMKELRSEILPI